MARRTVNRKGENATQRNRARDFANKCLVVGAIVITTACGAMNAGVKNVEMCISDEGGGCGKICKASKSTVKKHGADKLCAVDANGNCHDVFVVSENFEMSDAEDCNLKKKKAE